MIYFNKKKYKDLKEETTIKIDLSKIIKIIFRIFVIFY